MLLLRLFIQIVDSSFFLSNDLFEIIYLALEWFFTRCKCRFCFNLARVLKTNSIGCLFKFASPSIVRIITHAAILWFLRTLITILFWCRVECNLLELLLEAVNRSIVSIVLLLFCVFLDLTHPVTVDPRDVTPLLSSIFENWVLHSACCLANGEGKGASHAHLAYSLILDSLETSGMVTDFLVTHTNLTVWIRAPDHYFIVLVYDYDESATYIDTLDTDVVLEFYLTGSFEFSKNSGAPNVHDSIFSDGCTCVPSWDLLEFMRTTALTHLILWNSRIDPHGTELVLVRIVSNLSEVVGSEGPKLPTISLFSIIGE